MKINKIGKNEMLIVLAYYVSYWKEILTNSPVSFLRDFCPFASLGSSSKQSFEKNKLTIIIIIIINLRMKKNGIYKPKKTVHCFPFFSFSIVLCNNLYLEIDFTCNCSQTHKSVIKWLWKWLSNLSIRS